MLRRKNFGSARRGCPRFQRFDLASLKIGYVDDLSGAALVVQHMLCKGIHTHFSCSDQHRMELVGGAGSLLDHVD